MMLDVWQSWARECKTLQHTATHCNTLQHAPQHTACWMCDSPEVFRRCCIENGSCTCFISFIWTICVRHASWCGVRDNSWLSICVCMFVCVCAYTNTPICVCAHRCALCTYMYACACVITYMHLCEIRMCLKIREDPSCYVEASATFDVSRNAPLLNVCVGVHVHLHRAVCCSVMQCVAVCCSVLQCVAVCCNVSAFT